MTWGVLQVRCLLYTINLGWTVWGNVADEALRHDGEENRFPYSLNMKCCCNRMG